MQSQEPRSIAVHAGPVVADAEAMAYSGSGSQWTMSGPQEHNPNPNRDTDHGESSGQDGEFDGSNPRSETVDPQARKNEGTFRGGASLTLELYDELHELASQQS